MVKKQYGKGVVAVIPKTESVDIVIKVEATGDYPGIHIRQFVKTDTYNGYTKKGVIIPPDKAGEFGKAIAEATGKLK